MALNYETELRVLREEILKAKLDMFEYMAMLGAKDTVLEHCGFRQGLGSALEKVLKDTTTKIEKRTRAFEKLFPD